MSEQIYVNDLRLDGDSCRRAELISKLIVKIENYLK